MNLRILLVEDEQTLAETIKLNLELEGYTVNAVNDGKKAVKAFKQGRYNLIILDVMLPEMDGFSVCESIRLENTDVPILILTAKSSGADRVKGLRIGADDYLTKPFNLEEMLLRVRKLINRSLKGSETGNEKLNHYTLNGHKINFTLHEVKTREGKILQLTPKETALLKLLIERKNEIVSREHILEIAWGYDIYPSTRTIDNFMVSFRKYFETDPSNPRYFHSVRGIGYKFRE
ncbi:MAG: response regulator transcription factor [Bacteroidota bacterium]